MINTAGIECFPKLICEWWSRKLSWSRTSLSTFWYPTRGISVQSSCTSQSGPLSGMSFWIQPDLQLVLGRVVDTIFRTETSRTLCTTQAMSWLGGSYLHFPRHLSCVTLFIFTFFQASSVNSFRLLISLKICLTISFVSSSQALMSSARIPSLSGDLPFMSILIASCNSSFVVSGILVISSVSLMCTLANCRREVFCSIHRRHWRSHYVMSWFLLFHSESL